MSDRLEITSGLRSITNIFNIAFKGDSTPYKCNRNFDRFIVFYTDMSSPEPTEDSQDETEEEPQKYTQPLTALPPRVVQQEESQVEVSASPAFQCLDEVRTFKLEFYNFITITREQNRPCIFTCYRIPKKTYKKP